MKELEHIHIYKFNLKSDRVDLVALSYWVPALFNQCPGDTVQTGIGKDDRARKFKCTKAGRDWSRFQTATKSFSNFNALNFDVLSLTHLNVFEVLTHTHLKITNYMVLGFSFLRSKWHNSHYFLRESLHPFSDVIC